MFVKRGERVADEAAALAAAGGHAGVVELVGAEDGVLRTRMVDGRPLAELGPLPPDEVAGVAGPVATTLADLHELGVVHGAVDAGHVLVGADGKVVLCSLGRGGKPADDVAALGHLVARLLAGEPGGDGAAGRWRPGRRPGPTQRTISGRRRGPGRRTMSGRRRSPGQSPMPGSNHGPVPGRNRRSQGAGHRRPARAKERVRARLGLQPRLGPMLGPPAAPALAALAEQATDPDPRRRPTARAFAAAVHQQVPTARIPVPKPRPLVPDTAGRPPGPLRTRRPRTGLTAVLFLFALAAYGGVIALVTSALSDHGRGRPPTGTVPERAGFDSAVNDAVTGAGGKAGAGGNEATAGGGGAATGAGGNEATAGGDVAAPGGGGAEEGAGDKGGGPGPVGTTTMPLATRVWPPEPLDYTDGVLTVDGVRYALGRRGDAVAAGDWGCTGRRTLVLLRASTGEVFAFDGWAEAGDTLVGRRVGSVAGASALRAVDADGDGCDDLELERSGRPPVHLEVHQ